MIFFKALVVISSDLLKTSFHAVVFFCLLTIFVIGFQEESKPPAKKLRLIHKPKIVESQLSLQNATTSYDAMQALLRFEDTLPIGEEQVEQVLQDSSVHSL